MLESDKKTGKRAASTRKKTARSKKSAASTAEASNAAGARKTARRKASAKKTIAKSTATTKKTPRKKRTTSRTRKPAPRCISVEERRQLIAEQAYFLAEARGFRGGDEREDWLQAEADVDARLLSEGVRIE